MENFPAPPDKSFSKREGKHYAVSFVPKQSLGFERPRGQLKQRSTRHEPLTYRPQGAGEGDRALGSPTRFLIAGSWGFSNFLFLRRCTSSDFLLEMESTGDFLACSSDFRLGVSSHSLFRFAASVTSLLSRFIFCSFSSEPGRLDAYLNPGPRFCLYAKETQKTQANFISSLFFFVAVYNKSTTCDRK